MKSGKKKSSKKKRTYSQGEYVRSVRIATDNAVKTVILLALTAVRDEFEPDAETLIRVGERMQRYVRAEAAGLVDLDVASESLMKHTGIDLRLSRW